MSEQIRNSQSAMRNLGSPVIELHIGELVLEGFPDLQAAQLGAVVQDEMGRLLAENGVPAGLAHSGEVESLDGGKFQMTRGSDAQSIGSQIAHAVYGQLAR